MVAKNYKTIFRSLCVSLAIVIAGLAIHLLGMFRKAAAKPLSNNMITQAEPSNDQSETMVMSSVGVDAVKKPACIEVTVTNKRWAFDVAGPPSFSKLVRTCKGARLEGQRVLCGKWEFLCEQNLLVSKGREMDSAWLKDGITITNYKVTVFNPLISWSRLATLRIVFELDDKHELEVELPTKTLKDVLSNLK